MQHRSSSSRCSDCIDLAVVYINHASTLRPFPEFGGWVGIALHAPQFNILDLLGMKFTLNIWMGIFNSSQKVGLCLCEQLQN